MDSDHTWQFIHSLTGNSEYVNSLTLSPDGHILAGGSRDSKIYLWNVGTGELIKTLSEHSGGISSIAISPDGKTFASGGDDATIKIWHLATGKLLQSLAVPKRADEVLSIAISPDGQTLASGGYRQYKNSGGGSTVYLWDLSSGNLRTQLIGHLGPVYSVAFSPDGQILATGSWDKTIKLWNLETEKLINTLTGHSSSVYSIVISPDRQTLASSGADDFTMNVWNLHTGELLHTLNTDYAHSIIISPDGETLISATQSGIELWNLRNINNKEQPKQFCEEDSVLSVAISSDGQLLASSSADNTIKIWRSSSLQLQELENVSSTTGKLKAKREETQQSSASKFAAAQELAEVEGYFNDPENPEDARKRIVVLIVRRQGQPKFRKRLLEAYNGRCAITGCDAEAALEAAHISPYRGEYTNQVSNGLLLRADIHTLFDLYLLSIDPETKKVLVAPSLAKTYYGTLVEYHLRPPKDEAFTPNKNALEEHRDAFLHKQKNVEDR
jgi:WD40 repeat protein